MFNSRCVVSTFSGLILAGVSTSVAGYATGGVSANKDVTKVKENSDEEVQGSDSGKLTGKLIIGTALAGIVFCILVNKGISHFKSYAIASKLSNKHVDKVFESVKNNDKAKTGALIDNIVTEAINGKNDLLKQKSGGGRVYRADSKEWKEVCERYGIKELTKEEHAYLWLLLDASSEARDIVYKVKYFQENYADYLKNFEKYMALYRQYEVLMKKYYVLDNKCSWAYKYKGSKYVESKGWNTDSFNAMKEVEKFYEEKMKGFFSFLSSCDYLLKYNRKDKNDDVVTTYGKNKGIYYNVSKLEKKVKAIRDLRNKNITDKSIADKHHGLPDNINELNRIIDNLDDFKNNVDLRKRFELPEKVVIPELKSFEYGRFSRYDPLFPERTIWHPSKADLRD